MAGDQRTGRVRRPVLALALAAAAAGCATYDERIREVHQAYYGGQQAQALAVLEPQVSGEAGVFSGGRKADRDLLALELAMVQQAAGRHAEAADLLSEVDDSLEILDYSTTTAEDVSAFLFSSEAATWKASPPERLMVNTQGMLNRLAAGDVSGAAVEARRAHVLLEQVDLPEEELFANRFVRALAAFSLEQAGVAQEADDAWMTIQDSPLAPAPGGRPADHGTLLVVAQLGKAPIRRERVYAIWIDELVHLLRVPVLMDRPDRFRAARLAIDNQDLGELPALFDLGPHLTQRYEQELPALMAAAATQAVLRGVVAEGVKQGMESEAEDEGDEAAAAFAGLFTSLFLSELQPADTRCWSLLPQAFHVARQDLPAGRHQVVVGLGGDLERRVEREIEVRPGALSVVIVTSETMGGWQPLADPQQVDAKDLPAAEQAIAILSGVSLAAEIVD